MPINEAATTALDASVTAYTAGLIAASTNTAIRAHIIGDVLAHNALGLPVVNAVVQNEALIYGETYRKLLVEKGASIIQGKEIPWLSEQTTSTRSSIFQIIESGIAEGKPVADIGGKVGVPGTVAHDLEEYAIRSKNFEYVRIARTTTAQIQNQGTLNRFEKSNIIEALVHDGHDFDDACAAADGQIWSLEYCRTHELEHPNCLTKDTKVMGGFNGIMRSYYSGPVIDIVTNLGRRLSVTPNHPILTSEGFIPAKSIHKGSELVCYAPFVKDSSIYPNDKHEPIVIEEIFDMLSLLCIVERVPVSPEDLHGDAMRGDGYIDIIDMHSLLPYNFKPNVLKQIRDIFLEPATPDDLLLSRVCSHDFSGGAVGASSASTPSAREHLFFFKGGVPLSTPNDLNCLRAGSNVNSVMLESSFDDAFSAVEFFTKLRDSNAGLIEFDHVVDITIREYNDHVYDLLTNTQYYNASGVFIHNCTRSFSPIVPDDWEPPE